MLSSTTDGQATADGVSLRTPSVRQTTKPRRTTRSSILPGLRARGRRDAERREQRFRRCGEPRSGGRPSLSPPLNCRTRAAEGGGYPLALSAYFEPAHGCDRRQQYFGQGPLLGSISEHCGKHTRAFGKPKPKSDDAARNRAASLRRHCENSVLACQPLARRHIR